ncbi:heterogeneous nuclear ribonucleoprotein M-like [Galendromus occidentalis]|uniref:Heterogeneous nuclear ribonucleoprotein M-like n=1 Tax=Galendromus occidentalis TaxID=34638 RepID=A0AAJ7L7F7_9ACAR|nr:heterogeneous nuclear ribonucleoprotein M-like [Galendromus occidentalis]
MAHRDRSRSPIQLRAPCERRVYVANIPFDMKWTELKDLFKRECGENSVSFVRYFEDTDGKFRGCGIVEFKDSEATKKAIEKLHRFELNGRFLVVKEDYDVERDSTGRVVTTRGGRGGQKDRESIGHGRDRSPPRRERSPQRDYGSNHVGSVSGSFNTYGLSPKFLDSLGIDLPLTNKLFIANLDYKVTRGDLKRLFKLCGRVLDVELYVDKDGNSKGNATVELDHPIEAVQAISMLNRQIFHGRPIAIRMDRKDSDDLKLPPGLEGVGKGLGPGGAPLRLPRDFPPVGSGGSNPTPAPPAPAPVPPVSGNPMANLVGLGNPNAAPAALAALSTVLGSLAGQSGAGMFGGSNQGGGGMVPGGNNLSTSMGGSLASMGLGGSNMGGGLGSSFAGGGGMGGGGLGSGNMGAHGGLGMGGGMGGKYDDMSAGNGNAAKYEDDGSKWRY